MASTEVDVPGDTSPNIRKRHSTTNKAHHNTDITEEDGDDYSEDEDFEDNEPDNVPAIPTTTTPTTTTRRKRPKSKFQLEIDRVVTQTLLPRLFDVALRVETSMEQRGDMIERLYARYLAEQDKLNHLVPLFWIAVGLVLIFWGSHVVTTMAFFAAFQHGGSDKVKAQMLLLVEQLKQVRMATKQDALVDADGDGIPDVLQISKEDLSKRKLRVILGAIQPEVVQSALSSLWSALFVSAATTKLHQAKTISLGLVLGSHLARILKRYVLPAVQRQTSHEVKKFNVIVLTQACAVLGVFIAFYIGKTLSVVATAIKGSELVVDECKTYTKDRGWTRWSRQIAYWDDVLIACLIVLGSLVQFFMFDTVPWVMQMVTFPVFVTEAMLKMFVSSL